VKSGLPEIIAEESIITSDGKKLIKVPIRSLEEYRFRFDPYQGDRVGQGDGSSEVGDVIAKGPAGDQGGKGKQAGDEPGTDFYEAEVTVDDLAELIFEDLGLPDLRPKATQEIPTESVKFTEVRKKGPMSNLDKRRTIMENVKRNAMHGEPGFGNITNEDLRFKVWEQETRPSSSAVVVAMRDASGSMGEFKKYITRSLFFWMVRFLRTKYQDVEIVFITHHSETRVSKVCTSVGAPLVNTTLCLHAAGYNSTKFDRIGASPKRELLVRLGGATARLAGSPQLLAGNSYVPFFNMFLEKSIDHNCQVSVR
jgi:sporulation protein YhbH